MEKLLKIDLHCHLDGSLRPETVWDIMEKENIENNFKDLEELRGNLIAPKNCDSLDSYLKSFEIPVKIMQSKYALERVTYELMEDCALENIKYLEIRFAPQLHRERGLNYDEILESVIAGIEKAEKNFDIRGNIIISYLRNTSVEGLEELIDRGKNYLDRKVVGLDLCGGERDSFSNRFKGAIGRGKDLGFNISIHAGETGIEKNIEEAINLLGAQRIGHGVAMTGKKEIKDLVKENNIFIECCPNSNLQTKAVEKIGDHPFYEFFKEGIMVTLNTDNRTVSNTSMTKELKIIGDNFPLENIFWRDIYINGVEGSFADMDTKKWLVEKLGE